jgi:hypothetical protein
MIGFPPPATAPIRVDKILGKLKPILVAQCVYQHHLSRLSIVYASSYHAWRKLELLPRPQASRLGSIVESIGNQPQVLGCFGKSASKITMEAMPIRSMSSTSKSVKNVSAEAGHDLISFINASPTRKITREVNGSRTFTY